MLPALSESKMQSQLHGKCIQTICNQITFIIEIFTGKAGADAYMTREIISNSEFQARRKISFQIRICHECVAVADYFSVYRDGISNSQRNIFFKTDRLSKVEFSK